MHYSPSTGGFYDARIHATIPDDAVEITSELYQQLLAGIASGLVVTIGEDGLPRLAPPPLPDAAAICARVDVAADAARRKVAGDPLRAVEYETAAAEARSFAAAGYPADAVPRTVSAWALNGRTAQQAADDILAEARAYTEAFYLVRETRLQAKELVRAAIANGDGQLAQDIADEAIAAIEASIQGVGNAHT